MAAAAKAEAESVGAEAARQAEEARVAAEAAARADAERVAAEAQKEVCCRLMLVLRGRSRSCPGHVTASCLVSRDRYHIGFLYMTDSGDLR